MNGWSSTNVMVTKLAQLAASCGSDVDGQSVTVFFSDLEGI
jgi:hypothetical protein